MVSGVSPIPLFDAIESSTLNVFLKLCGIGDVVDLGPILRIADTTDAKNIWCQEHRRYPCLTPLKARYMPDTQQ